MKKNTHIYYRVGETLSISEDNAACLKKELDWFNQVLETRISLYFGNDCPVDSIYDIAAPSLAPNGSFYEQVVTEHDMNIDERLVMLLALIPHIRPQVLDTFFIRNKNFDRTFTEFGGWRAGAATPTADFCPPVKQLPLS
jgi:hypothetical protein